MSKRKVGLVLGGGGAKGSYQIGVYKAMRDHHLIDDIEAISGTSIGALNLVLLSSKEVDKAEKIWVNLSRKKVLTFKKLSEYFSAKNFSILSRRGMLDIFSSDIDFKKLSDCKIPLYVCATNLKANHGETFKINGKTEQQIIDYLSASSAIPTVFQPVLIDGEYYFDGYLYRNVPIDTLIEHEGCNYFYVIPLSATLAPKEGDHPEATVIDFNERKFFDLKLWDGTLSFGSEIAKERIALGYDNADRLISYLRKKGVIAVTRREKFAKFMRKLRGKDNDKKYYSLEDLDPRIRYIGPKREVALKKNTKKV